MLSLDPVPKIITFDCYGTLVQWHRAVRDAAHAVLSARASQEVTQDQASALADRLRAAAAARQQRAPFLGYKALLGTALEQALGESGYTPGGDDKEIFLSGLRHIAPQPDAPAALNRLRARYRLGIVSNTDDDLIAGTVAAIGVPIDFVVTAQQAQAYKPDHRLFQFAHATMGVTRDETIHVGMGQFTDMKVCAEMGIRSVWIDRDGEAPNPDWPPHAVLRDLSGLPDLLLPA